MPFDKKPRVAHTKSTMPKVSSLFKASVTITCFFAIDKVVALVRQWIIIRQYGFTSEMDAFNVANNLPDLLASLIAGGAFAVAFIPVLSEYLHKKGSEETWLLFSRVANLVFLATAALSLLVAIFARSIVGANFGIAPGFNPQQRSLVVELMRLDLIATLIFSLSGLVTSALQSRKHFLLPALAPTVYNLGQIFGATVLTPFLGIGIYGLAYGVLIGAFLHLTIQIPGMIRHRYHWSLSLSLRDIGVQKVLKLMGPRILTVLFIQIIFLTRDNLASRLPQGAVTALTYGYFIMQVPGTLIGTAIATALLPTISQLVHHQDKNLFTETVNRALRAVLTLTLITTVITILGLESLVRALFHFSDKEIQLLVWTASGYLVGLTSQCILEIVVRIYYARQDAKTPLIVTSIRMLLFILTSWVLFHSLGAFGLAIADSLTVTFEMIVLIILLARSLPVFFQLRQSLTHAILASIVATLVFFLTTFTLQSNGLVVTLMGMLAAGISALFVARREIQLFVRL